MTATIVVDSFPARSFDGWVGFISPVAEFTPKTVQTEDLRHTTMGQRPEFTDEEVVSERIYEGEDQYYIHPDECIDCQACEAACPVQAIFPDNGIPEKWNEYIAKNKQFFQK